MDGLVFPDRTPHTGILEYKNVYRPVRVVSYDQETGKLVLHNYLDFDDLKDYLDIRFEVIKDGLSTVQKRKTFSILCNATYRRRDRVKRNHSQRRKNLFETDIPFKEGNTFPEEKFHSWICEILLKNEDGRNQMALSWLEKTDRKRNPGT